MVALVLDGLVGFPAGLSPTSLLLSPTSLNVSPTSFHLSPRLGACSRVSGRLVSHFLAFVSHFFPKQFTVGVSQFFLKTCPPFVSLLVSAPFRWPCSISIHLSPLVSALFVGHAAFLFISLPGLSLLVSALFRWACNISIHLFSRSVTAGVRPLPLVM